MKLRIIKTIEIDTSHERKRINHSFKKDKDTQKHLHELMDLVEACDWGGCINLLNSDWWKEYDPKGEHSRLEFIGGIHDKDGNFLGYANESYLNLIEKMFIRPDVYKAEKIGE